MGVSGGEEGARLGPSLMPGGPREAYESVRPILEKIAAQTDSGACVTWVGELGAGNYVKMIHNGIEYGDMQLIAEAYDILKNVGGLTGPQLANVFETWNKGELDSFLVSGMRVGVSAQGLALADSARLRCVCDEPAAAAVGVRLPGASPVKVPQPLVVHARRLDRSRSPPRSSTSPTRTARRSWRRSWTRQA